MNPVGGDMPVYTYTSAEGFGCAGCHGQNYGETIPMGLGLQNEGAPKASAYGLRKALDDLFAVTHPSDPAPCGWCHFPGSPVTGDPSPAPAIFPETVPPPYYGHPELTNLTIPAARRRRAGTAAPRPTSTTTATAPPTTRRTRPARRSSRPPRSPPRTTSTTTTTIPAAPPGGSPYTPASRSRTPSMPSRPAARSTSCPASTRKRTPTRTPLRSARTASG